MKNILLATSMLFVCGLLSAQQDLNRKTLAEKLILKGDVLSAVKLLNNHLDVNPDDAEAYTILGDAYFKDRQIDLAIQFYNKAMEVKHPDKDAKKHLDRAMEYKNAFSEAIADYNKVINRNPDLSTAYYNRAVLKYSLGLVSEGCEDLEMAKQLNAEPQFVVDANLPCN